MRSVFLFLICLSAFPANAIDIPTTASRTTGVAPLYVHFTAAFADSSAVQRGFHDRYYVWDFGDPASGTWPVSGKSRNTENGPVAAHVYQMPGKYTATLTTTDTTGSVTTTTFEITVSDPDLIYAGTATTCVSDTGHNDFTGCPPGAHTLATDDLSEIAGYLGPGSRVLLHRGSQWASDGENLPDNAGPVTLGAYGTCQSPDDLGLCGNAPHIDLTGTPAHDSFVDFSNKQDWRVQDLSLSGSTDFIAFGGAINMQRILLLRIRVNGCDLAVVWSHWKENADDLIDQLAVVACDFSQAYTNVVYMGGERLAVLGNRLWDASYSHVLRIWQFYLGTVRHNIISGANVDVARGRHALKLHGPREAQIDPEGLQSALAHRSRFGVVADNLFGNSGPWPVSIGPQNADYDERVSDLIFDKNRVYADYAHGALSPDPVQVSVNVCGRYLTLRNNLIEGTGEANGYYGITVNQRGGEPPPLGVQIYHNTIYRQGDGPNQYVGINVAAEAAATIARNNLVAFPGHPSPALISDASPDLEADHNLLSSTPGLRDPENANPLERDFRLLPGSPAIGQGTPVPVLDDISGAARPDGLYDIGAYRYPAPQAPENLRVLDD